MRITEWNAERLLARPQRILRDYGPVIGEEMKRQMATVQFDWPSRTLRFTSLFMQGTPSGAGRFSPPTTGAGASNTMAFKESTSGRQFAGEGILIRPGPRDAVDTGALLESQTPPVVATSGARSTMAIRWLAPYAATVLYGGDYGTYVNVKGRTVTVGNRPGRDWISPALREQPFVPFFRQRWRAGA